MKPLARTISLFLVVALVASCVPWREDYLTRGLNHATLDDVTRQLGPPHLTRKLTTGGEVWTYRYRATSIHGSKRYVHGYSYCTEYILIFDERGILREWRPQDC